jgi:hypothetical protein
MGQLETGAEVGDSFKKNLPVLDSDQRQDRPDKPHDDIGAACWKPPWTGTK